MHLTMTMLVRNEQDILRENILYHSHLGIDRFLVMNHLSTDGTENILTELSETLDIKVYLQSAPSYDQAPWMTFLSAEAYRLGTDWVITADADEFWLFPKDPKKYLEDKTTDVVLGYWQNCMPVLGVTPFYMNKYFTENENTKLIHKSRPDALIAMGNHNMDNRSSEFKDRELRVMHYQHRSAETLYNKYVLGGLSLEATNIPSFQGAHWRVGLDQYRKGNFDKFISEFFFQKEDLIKRHDVYINESIATILKGLL